MKPFFHSTTRQRRLAAEARQWLGTPFMPFQAVKGGGCDCAHLVHALAAACGFAHALEPPRYTLDATTHRDHCPLHDYLDAIPHCHRLDAGETYIPGDLLTFVMGRAPHHLGMVIAPPVFIHCMRGLGTAFAQVNDPVYAGRLSTVYRLTEP